MNNNFETQTAEVDGMTIEIHSGSGNVFQDLGFEDAAEMTLKAGLALRIKRAIRKRGVTQSAAAQIVGLKQPDLSNICNGRVDGISVERLFTVLNRLGHNIEIRVSLQERDDARTLVLT